MVSLLTASGQSIERVIAFVGDPLREGLISEFAAPCIFEGDYQKKESGERILEGLFQRGNQRNRNKRIYPMHILERETAKLAKIIKETNGIFGELDHPDTVVVNMKNACSRIDVLQVKDTVVEGKMTLLPTLPMGQWAIGCADALKGKLGVSSRGAGSLLKSGDDIMVGEDYNMRTYDCVHDPSTEGARPQMVSEQLIREFLDARPSTVKLMLGKMVDGYLGI